MQRRNFVQAAIAMIASAILALPNGSTNRLASQLFAQLFQAYMECNDQMQDVVRDMTVIVNDSNATEDEREAALSTMQEALFPTKHRGILGLDVSVNFR